MKRPESPSSEDPEASSSSDSFLHGIYLQKIPYKIIDTCVEEIEEKAFEPVAFVEAVKNFVDGQVYSLLTKDEDGQFKAICRSRAATFADMVVNEIGDRPVFSASKSDDDEGYLVYVIS